MSGDDGESSGHGAPAVRKAGKSSTGEIDAFLSRVRTMAPAAKGTAEPGRLLFALDATASRQPTWDRACHIQSDMFHAAGELGGLSIQLVFFRGFGECKSSSWTEDTATLARRMASVRCLGGLTQIGKVLRHAIDETKAKRVQAMVLVGDAFEEDIDEVCHAAGELGMLGVPVFGFHEGGDPAARNAFRQIAKLTGGACCDFDLASASQLRDLLRAVAVYAAGGRKALADHAERHGGAALRLTHQVSR